MPVVKVTLAPDIVQKIAQESVTGLGARQMTSGIVDILYKYWTEKDHILQITEAHSIEPQFDVPKFEYSLSGPLPQTGEGMKSDQENCFGFFQKLDRQAQSEGLIMRYNVWFTDYSHYLETSKSPE